MTRAPDGLYFRIRETGAQVFRVDTTNQNRRIEMEPLAVVNTRTGEVRLQGGRTFSETEAAEVAEWLADRQAALAGRDVEAARETIERLNLTAAWLQSRASTEDMDAVADDLLMAMHDLRSVIARRKADAL
jgi:hypothetical protein